MCIWQSELYINRVVLTPEQFGPVLQALGQDLGER